MTERTEPYTHDEILSQIHNRHLRVREPGTDKRDNLLMTYVTHMGAAQHLETGEWHLMAYTALGRAFIVDVLPFSDEASALAFGHQCAEAVQTMKPRPGPFAHSGGLN